MPLTPASSLQFRQLPGRLSADPLPAGVDDCAARIVRIPPGARTPHRHPRSPEVVYVVSGRGVAWEDGVTTPVGPGDVLTIPAGVPHATAASDELVLVCFFPAGDLAANLEELAGPVIAPIA